ncbi:Fic family protein [Gelidibacter sp. F2691]|nr:Fic family protein [Gelidibacter sp. F2691]
MSYQNTILEIEKIRKQVAALGSLSIEQKKKISYKFRLEWNYNSNSMEGNTLTMDDTKNVMVGNISINNKPLKDTMEMQGHDKVIDEILRIGKGELRLSEKRIKDIHTGIMYEVDEKHKNEIGQWKINANYIYNHKGERYDFATPDEVPEKTHDLLNRTNAAVDAVLKNKKNAPHPIEIALQFHLEYLAIHPFYDGNGRTARILTNLILVSFGYNPFWIDEKDRKIYYNLISDIQSYEGDKEPFFAYCAELVKRSEQIVLNVAEGKEIAEQEDLDKEIALLQKQWQGKELSKSPKLIADIFHFAESKIIQPCETTLRKFDKLFQEKKIFKKVNGDEKEKTVFDVLKTPKLGTIENGNHIYGFDIYETDVHTISYQYSQYGLANAQFETNLSFETEITFDAKQYRIVITVDFETVFNKEYAYGELPDAISLNEIPQMLGKLCLDTIKRKSN